MRTRARGRRPARCGRCCADSAAPARGPSAIPCRRRPARHRGARGHALPGLVRRRSARRPAASASASAHGRCGRRGTWAHRCARRRRRTQWRRAWRQRVGATAAAPGRATGPRRPRTVWRPARSAASPPSHWRRRSGRRAPRRPTAACVRGRPRAHAPAAPMPTSGACRSACVRWSRRASGRDRRTARRRSVRDRRPWRGR